MFTTGHFIWLGVIAVAIAAAIVLTKKFNVSQNAVQKTVFYALIVLKLFHVCLSMKESPDGGFVINQTQLSFHLCSLMIYSVILINVIKNEKFVKTMKSFMVPCMLLGAAMALLIPTEGVDALRPRVWQYMLIHGVLVFYGLYLMIVERVDLSVKAYLTNLKLLIVVVIFAFLMNSVLEQYNTNFLFLRKPPMDNLPILNLDNGWYVYFISLALVACALLFTVHIPYIIKNGKRKKTN
jgi:hypothetical integral membrane protein (TIGR02206 family)